MGQFAQAAPIYRMVGWLGTLPVNGKVLSVAGYSGQDGAYPTDEEVENWSKGSLGNTNIALRMPDGVIGIDVDAYRKGEVVKNGDVTLTEHEAKWGKLPPTWTSTSRGPGQPSRIHFYRVPVGTRLATAIRPDIEIIQRHHRYAVVWPSVHPDTGQQYRWYDPSGRLCMAPIPDELPELPTRWLVELSKGAASPAPEKATKGQGYALLAAMEADDSDPCDWLRGLLDDTVEAMHAADVGSRHDLVTARVMALVMCAANGHAGFGQAAERIRRVWSEVTAGEDREDELERMITSAAQRAVTAIGGVKPREHGSDGTLCEYVQILQPATTSPLATVTAPIEDDCQPAAVAGFDMWADLDPEDFEDDDFVEMSEEVNNVAAPTGDYLSDMLASIGTEPFNPADISDRGIAEAAAKRLRPYLRRLSSGTWLEKGDLKWVEVDDGAAVRALAHLGKLVPSGEDSKALRDKLNKARSLGSLATLMGHLSAGRGSDLYVNADETIGDPHVIWSGGRCINIRESTERMVYTDDHKDAVNTQTTRYAADLDCPTPLWDALTEAVWPDESVRKWALRVLSVAFTGEPAAILPVLTGEGGSGKTSIVETLTHVLGDYGHVLEPTVLHADSNKHGTYIYSLLGKRLAYVDEGPAESKAGTERLKMLTGGSRLQANQMRKDVVEFSPTHTLVMTTNYDPNVTDPALLRRLRIIPCNTPEALVRPARAALGTFTDPKAAIHREGPGILAKMIREAALWLGDRESADLAEAPASVAEYVEMLQEDQDMVGRFLRDCTVEGQLYTDSELLAADLYRSFVAWCEYQRIDRRYIIGNRRFGKELKSKSIPSRKSRKGVVYALELRPEANRFA